MPAPGESPDGPDRQAATPQIADPYALGGEFFRWEFAVAVAGDFLEINPFDQPDVQAAKDKTNEVLATGDGARRRAARARSTSCSRRRTRATTSACRRSSSRARRTTAASPTSSASCAAAAGSSSRTATGRATSTRPGSCTRAARTPASSSRSSTIPGEEIPIPGKPFGFRRLLRAQAAGDYASLQERGRRVARIHIEEA